jgi:hypothetical protein
VRGLAARRGTKNMYILRIEHPVPDYDAWKAAFDSDPIGRERSGVRLYRIMRPTDDPSYVMLELEFDTLREAVAVKAALGEVEFDTLSEAEAVRAALEDRTSPPEECTAYEYGSSRWWRPRSTNPSLRVLAH